MNILSTQMIEDDFKPTQKLSHLLPYEATKEIIQIGTLKIGSTTYPINQGVTNIGRHPRCNIILIDQTVSKKHAEIESNNGETWICDLNSSNKTKLNNSVLRSGRYYELKSGSVVEFGMVRAVYSELGSVDESLILATTAPNRLGTANTIIPGTPDTSINYSSTSEDDISMVPGTQAEKGDTIFRRPSAPPRRSASSRKSYLRNSSIGNSMNESRGSLVLSKKENLNEQRVSIHNMETQKSFESQNDSSSDIHNVETQNMSSCNSKHSDNQTDICDMGTQYIHNLKTPGITDVQNAFVEGDESTSFVKEVQTKEAELKVNVCSTNACKSVPNAVTRSKKAIVEKDEDSTHSEQLKISRRGSQNLLKDFIDDDPVIKSGPKSSSPSNSPVNKNEMSEQSSDKENISDAATQNNVNTENIIERVTQRVDCVFEASMEDDSDDTDHEGVFQRYSRVDSQDSSQSESQTKRQSDSGDSDTDDEGRFTVMAAKEREASSMSLEIRQNESRENKNDASDNSFQVSMQQVNLKDKDSSKDVSENNIDFNSPTHEKVTKESNVDIATPTQLIKVNKPVSIVMCKDTENADDLMSKQIIPNVEASTNANLVKDNATHSKEKEQDDLQYNTSTQISGGKVSTYNEPSSNDRGQLNPHLVEYIEDVKNEMASTKLLTEIEEKKRVSPQNKKRSRNVNLDNTMERNLNEMFNDVNKDIEDRPQISTQMLTNMPQSSQSEEQSTDLNIDKDSSRSNRSMSISKTRSKSLSAKLEVSPLTTNGKSRRSSLRNATCQNDSQDYFSNLTSARKRNILVDSGDSDSPSRDAADTKNEVETESVNQIVNDENIAPAAVLKLTPKNSPSARFSKTNKAEELNKLELVSERINSPKSNKNAVEDSVNGEEICDTPIGVGPSKHSVTTLDSDEEDIMSGLPEVQISGTLSNPASPASSTSTEFLLCTRSMKPKSGAKKAETKKKKAPKKSTRKSVARENTENNASSKIRKPKSTEISGIFNNFDMNRVPMTIQESDGNAINEIRPTKRMSSRKSLQSEPNPPQEEVKRSPFIQGNERTRATNKKAIDKSSIFQVSEEVLIAKEAESTRKTALRAPRTVKRSLSTTEVTESTIVKKVKEDVNEKTAVATKGRKSNARSFPATRNGSANILDYVMRKDSPVINSDSSQQSLTNSQESIGVKQLRIMITRLPSGGGTSTLPLFPRIAVKLTTENAQATVNSATSTSSEAESYKSTTAGAERNNSRRATNKYNVGDVSAQKGEESQEVEMIMNSWTKKQDINMNAKKQERNRNIKGVRASTRKRRHTNASTSKEDSSSEVYESDNPNFEAPTFNTKRARITRNTTNVDNVAANESIIKGRRKSANKETTKRKKEKVQKMDTEEKNEASILEETTSSGINSSINVSAISTPTRSRRSMSTSFATSSPYKITHKILFTGISNDYTKLLTKLGSSQVEDPTKCTVLVTDKVRRTVKFLCALAQAVPIVSVSWLVESEKAGRFVELDNYVLKDPAAEAKFGFRLRESLEKAKKQKLLDGYTVVLTPNVAPPLPELKSIINSCGGKSLVRPPSKWPEKTVIVSGEEDIASAKKFLAKAPKTVSIQSTEFILTGILRQEIDFLKYKLT